MLKFNLQKKKKRNARMRLRVHKDLLRNTQLRFVPMLLVLMKKKKN